MSATNFPLLIVLSVAFAAGSAAVALLFPELIPQSVSHALENEPLHRIFDDPFLALLLIVPFIVVAVAGTVGLFFFKRWARSASLYVTILGFGLYPILGPTVISPWSGALSDASFMLWGATLAIAYFSPLRDRFSRLTTNDR